MTASGFEKKVCSTILKDKQIFVLVKIMHDSYHKRLHSLWLIILYDSIVAANDYMVHCEAFKNFPFIFIIFKVRKSVCPI